jgi:hypothetical protein
VHQPVGTRDEAQGKRVRACIDCGIREERRREQGRDEVNLDPVSGRCVQCLIAYAKAGFRVIPDLPAD